MSDAAREGAERDPFSLTASAEEYVPTTAVARALREASAALEAGRVPLITGPTGLGKSLTLQLLGRAFEDRCRVLYVPYCSLGPADLAALVLGLLEQPQQDEPELALLFAARRSAQEGRPLLLLVDDAGSLPGDTAAQLAHWTLGSEGALRVAMSGLPGATLWHARDAFGDEAEEVFLTSGLDESEVRGYVDARLERAGADPEVRAAFDAGAVRELHRVSGGNPRKLNLAAQAIVRNAYGVAAQSGTGGGQDRAAADVAAATRSTSPWEDLAGVGEYRFVRGTFVDPKTGERVPAPPPLPLPREEIRRGRASDVIPPVDDDFELETDAVEEGDAFGLDELETSDVAEAPEWIPAPEEEPPLSPRASRRSGLAWAAGVVVVVAFGIGVWSQMGREGEAPTPPPEPTPQASTPARGIRPEPVLPAEPEPLREPFPEMEPEVVAEEPAEAAEPAEAEPVEAAEPAPESVAIAEPPAPVVPEPEPEVAPEPEAEPEPAVEPEPAAPAPPAPPPAETVAVAINATPWAVIEIDGKEVGETPLAGIELTTGRHRFKATMPDGSIQERVVRVDADTTRVVFE